MLGVVHQNRGDGQPEGLQRADRTRCRHVWDGDRRLRIVEQGKPNASVSAAGIKYAGCMRAHDVTNFPDPSAGGGGVQIGGSGIDPASPAFVASQNACRHLLPGGGTTGALIAVPSTIKLQSPNFKLAAAACQFPVFGRHA